MTIIPIAWTNVNWEIFVTQCNKHLGRSPTRSLDSKGSLVGSLDSFISALNEFSSRGSQVFNESVLNHISLTFFMILDNDDFIELVEKGNRAISFTYCEDSELKYKKALIATATLKDWKDFIILTRPTEFTYIMWNMLHSMGFGQVFLGYKINSKKEIEKR